VSATTSVPWARLFRSVQIFFIYFFIFIFINLGLTGQFYVMARTRQP